MLGGKTIAVPETRQLDVLAGLLERRGATVWRCPLVSIKDAPDATPIVKWLKNFTASPPDLLILFTGEGLTRLLKFAMQAGLEEAFIAALGRTDILSRGPKPAKVLRKLSMRPTVFARVATTDGVIDTLKSLSIDDRRVAVQLYGSDPNEKLMSYLRTRSVEVEAVAPYIYADESDDDKTRELILALHHDTIDMIAFTSKTQVERLFRVAKRYELQRYLVDGLKRTKVAAVGPVVEQYLEQRGITVSITPQQRYFMKPLAQEIVDTMRPLVAAANS